MLLPWKRILANVGLGLNGDWKKKAFESLQNVGLEDRAQNYPIVLSGGQKKRVALARALVHEPELLLLDEPLGALDALTRMEMQTLIESLWKRKHYTSILVTHDVEEAVYLSDRVILLEDGKITLDLPIDLTRPRRRSHANFNRYVEDILAHIIKGNHNNMRSIPSETGKIIRFSNK